MVGQHLDSPPGALRRLKQETFDDSHKIFGAVAEVINRITSVMPAGLAHGGADEHKIYSSPNGTKLTYEGNTMQGVKKVCMIRPFPNGEETFALELYEQGDGFGSRIYEPFVRIKRQVSTSDGKKAYLESGKAFNSEEAYHTYRPVTVFSTGVLHRRERSVESKPMQSHPSVIDPLAILDIITHEFPQLLK